MNKIDQIIDRDLITTIYRREHCELKPNQVYLSTVFFDPATGEKLPMRITRIAKGVVYVKPQYQDRRYGQTSKFAVEDAAEWLVLQG